MTNQGQLKQLLKKGYPIKMQDTLLPDLHSSCKFNNAINKSPKMI